jgi:hypothetical protein
MVDKERRKKIVAACPLLYAKCICFQCCDGWLDIIEKLSNRLEKLIVEYKEKYPEKYVPRCVETKEKYGILRFYMDDGTDEMYEAIDAAEEESSETCEMCGKPGELNKGPWYSTLCPEHMS